MRTNVCVTNPRIDWNNLVFLRIIKHLTKVANGVRIVIEATLFVTGAIVNVWTGIKQGGTDPAGDYPRLSGCDPTVGLSVEACV